MSSQPSPGRSPAPSRSLRSHLRLAGFLLASLALVAMLALVASTAYLQRLTQGLTMTVESLRLAEEVQAELLAHHHVATSRSEEHAREAALIGQQLQQLLSWAHGHSSSEEEHRLLADLDVAVRDYLQGAASAISAASDDHAEHGKRLAALYDEAFARSRAVVEHDLQQARAARRHADVHQATAVTAVAVAVALLVGLALLARSLRHTLFTPLERVGEAIRAYASDRSSRAPEIGPIELRSIAEAFNGLASELQTQRESQMRFLGGVAHDLRNPLGALKNACALVRADRPLPGEPHLRRMLLIASRCVDRLNAMVEDLLDISRVELGRLPIDPRQCDLREIARDAAGLFECTEASHALVVDLPQEPALAWCDAGRIAQVLNNLVSNAIKYSPDGGTVRIAARMEDHAGVLEVTDSGIGIPEDEISRIFLPFRRSSFTEDGIPGIGLGLFVSRKLVEAHGGRLTVDSVRGKGSTFRICLPRSAQAAEVAGVAPQRSWRWSASANRDGSGHTVPSASSHPD